MTLITLFYFMGRRECMATVEMEGALWLAN